jgi:hypothetical protein
MDSTPVYVGEKKRDVNRNEQHKENRKERVKGRRK